MIKNYKFDQPPAMRTSRMFCLRHKCVESERLMRALKEYGPPYICTAVLCDGGGVW